MKSKIRRVMVVKEQNCSDRQIVAWPVMLNVWQTSKVKVELFKRAYPTPNNCPKIILTHIHTENNGLKNKNRVTAMLPVCEQKNLCFHTGMTISLLSRINWEGRKQSRAKAEKQLHHILNAALPPIMIRGSLAQMSSNQDRRSQGALPGMQQSCWGSGLASPPLKSSAQGILLTPLPPPGPHYWSALALKWWLAPYTTSSFPLLPAQ